jgi:hypothetical protein
MKKIYFLTFLAVAAVAVSLLKGEQPTNSEFPGVKKAMAPEDYAAAGLEKLDPAERAKLDEFIRVYVNRSNEKVATSAVDKAVKENKVQAPEVIESRIVGPFNGYNGRTVFTLENGQHWAQSQRDTAYFRTIDSPPVVIVKSGLGYRMHIAGGGSIRVSLVR